MALNRRTANLNSERLKAFRDEIQRAYEAETIVGQVCRVAEVLDRTPSDFLVISNSERRRLDHFNDPSYIWDRYCRDLARSVALGEERYLFQHLMEHVKPSRVTVSSQAPDFDVFFDSIHELRTTGYVPDVLCAPISTMVPFLKSLHSRLRWGSHPRETLIAPDGTELRVFWSSRIAPLDRFIIFDSSGSVWKVKPDPESGHRLAVAIGEPEDYPDSVVWLAETVVKYEITNPTAFCSILLEGDVEETSQGE